MLLQYFESNGFSLFFDMDPTPSVRTHLPSQQSTTTLGLGCVSSPFNNAPSTIKQTAQSDRLPPFHNYYQPYVQSAVWHTEYTCNTRAAQPVFYPAKVMKENWKLVMVTHLQVTRALPMVILSSTTAITFIVQNGRGKKRRIYLIRLRKGHGKITPLPTFLTSFQGSAAIKSANSLRKINYLIRLKQTYKSLQLKQLKKMNLKTML